MNILVITQYFWPENFRINDLVVGLKEKGHQVTVFTGQPNYPKGQFYDGYGIFKKWFDQYKEIRLLRVPLVTRGKGGFLRLAINYASFLFFSCLMILFRCRDRYDLIFVYGLSPITVCLPGIMLKKFKKIPLFVWVLDLWPDSLSATGAIRSVWILSIVRKLVYFIYHHCDRILVQSRGFIPHIKNLDVTQKKIYYFPNTAEGLFQIPILEEGIHEKMGIPQGFCVMFAGNIGVTQDFSTILKAAEHLRNYPDIHWVILGDGRVRSWVEDEVSRRELRKTFHLLGNHPLESMPLFFSFADVMLATLKKEEIFAMTIPGKIQSYLASGKVIVAAMDGEGAKVLQESGAGIAVPAEDALELAKAVLKIYHMPDKERKEMGERGLCYFRSHFEREMLLTRLNAWIEEEAKKR